MDPRGTGLARSLQLAAFLLLLGGCRTETAPARPDPGPDFRPMAVGRQWIYRMDSILFRPTAQGIDTIHTRSYMRERITDSVFGGALRLERSRSASPEGPWQPLKAIRWEIDQNRWIQTEDNRSLIPLVYPLQDGKCWTPTVLMDPLVEAPVGGQPLQVYKNWEACMVFDRPPAPIGQAFPAAGYLRVQLTDWASVLESRQVHSWYGQGIGLLYSQWQILDSQCQYCCAGDLTACRDVSWPERAERGFLLTQTLVTYQ